MPDPIPDFDPASGDPAAGQVIDEQFTVLREGNTNEAGVSPAPPAGRIRP